MNYFNKLPTITYDGQLAKNLLVRADLSSRVRETKEAFYKYTMDGLDRADTLAYEYYDSPRFTWLVWFANETIDPLYDLPLSEDDFFRFIEKKYGSFAKAQRSIRYFRNNWYDNTEDRLTVSQYDTLSQSLKKYWEPIVDGDLIVTAYQRKRVDDVVETNRVVSLNISGPTGNFEIGEEIQANTTNYATVTFANSTVVTCNKLVGNIVATDTITGQTSSAVATVDVSTTLTSSVAETDAVYWSPVTDYEYEQELNEFKKYIRLVDVRFAGQAENELRRVMNAK